MFRFRRYRVFVACAVVFVFLLYRVSINAAWDQNLPSQYRYVASAVLPDPAPRHLPTELDQKPLHPFTSGHEPEDDRNVKIPELKQTPDVVETPPTRDNAPAPTTPPTPKVKVPNLEDVPLHIQKPPARVEPVNTFTAPIHWTPMPERFPVPKHAVIPLPTGKPKSIPAIQHKFGQETSKTKEERQKRLAAVKSEMQHAWAGYSKYAFGHDELTPAKGGYSDAFGGWGATLVDSMDTLWIMGMKDEFEEAYRGVAQIDFTTCNRNDIPVFETTIRYLGGLIAAYDMTGGRNGDYPLLLKKATELADILMSIFDTPNRMPVLYYDWRPAFASQPHRASPRSGIAEIATLSMEFTRLAQLTGLHKYYDAVARITNALDEWKNRDDDTAPLIPGIFPTNLDASGCNQSATTARLGEHIPSRPAKAQTNSFTPGEPQGYIPNKPPRASVDLRMADNLENGASNQVTKRTVKPRTPPPSPGNSHWSSGVPSKRGSTDSAPAAVPLGADGLPVDWECVAKNLTAATGVQEYGMGGSQDSAYEYFPKQYLLLAGLEPKYRSLHEDTVAAVKKHLLFRPLAEHDPDILFSAKLRVSADKNAHPDKRIQREHEVTHLGCFLGGMFAMGAKIFDSEEDLDIGRRLTDGCVWAYSSMPAGIMAEGATLAACENMDSCKWNETQWHLDIDPTRPGLRETQQEDYIKRLAEWEDRKAKLLRAEAERLQAEEELGKSFSSIDEQEQKALGTVQGQPVTFGGASHNQDGIARRDDDSRVIKQTRQKRTLDSDTGDTLAFDPSTLDQEAIERKIKILEEEFDNPPLPPPPEDSLGGVAPIDPLGLPKNKIPIPLKAKIATRPHKPQTHAEYVNERITKDALPPGYVKIGYSGYMLRPEAIESVWYMYRITGDPTWQEKGWKMWQAIINTVKTDIAHTAIYGVNEPGGASQLDNMQSFWLAETLKYFYLLFAEPDVVSLDEWVLNTEAHPFKRPS